MNEKINSLIENNSAVKSQNIALKCIQLFLFRLKTSSFAKILMYCVCTCDNESEWMNEEKTGSWNIIPINSPPTLLTFALRQTLRSRLFQMLLLIRLFQWNKKKWLNALRKVTKRNKNARQTNDFDERKINWVVSLSLCYRFIATV